MIKHKLSLNTFNLSRAICMVVMLLLLQSTSSPSQLSGRGRSMTTMTTTSHVQVTFKPEAALPATSQSPVIPHLT